MRVDSTTKEVVLHFERMNFESFTESLLGWRFALSERWIYAGALAFPSAVASEHWLHRAGAVF